MNIEELAVHKVEGMLHVCQKTRSYIDKNDRTPFTDGHIDVYSSNSHIKENHLGRVAIQVKGRATEKKREFPTYTTYQVSCADLRGFLKTNGVLFFLVLIDKNDLGRKKVYYSLLNPFKINYTLGRVRSDQKSVAIRFKSFPHLERQIEPLLHLALRSQDERPNLGFDPSLFSKFCEIAVYTDGELDLSRPVKLEYTTIDYSIVLRTDGGMEIPIPGEMHILPADYISRPTDLEFRCGDHVFTNPTVRRISDEYLEFQLSEGLAIVVPDSRSENGGKIHLSLQDSLSERFDDLGFFLACFSEGCYSVNEQCVKFDVATRSPDEELLSHYRYLSRLRALLLALDADPRLIVLSEITDIQSDQLSRLSDHILDNEEISVPTVEGRIVQPIGQWYLELVQFADAELGSTIVRSLFSRELSYRFAASVERMGSEASVSLVTPYEIARGERFGQTANLNLERIVEWYADLSHEPGTFVYANHMVLDLISAADSIDVRRVEFLAAARTLNDWLLVEEGPQNHNVVNRWQIDFRAGILTDDQRSKIRSMRRGLVSDATPLADQLRFCCSVLLRDFEEAECDYHLLSEGSRKALRGWPIWNLYVAPSDQFRRL